MSSYYQPKTPPPPPARSATLRQIVVMLVFGSIGSVFVINAIQSQPGNSLGVGAALIVSALVFFAGLISRKTIVEYIACGYLLIGAGFLAALAVNERDVLWGVGAVFFVMCIAVILLKHRFIDQSTAPDGELKNPYS